MQIPQQKSQPLRSRNPDAVSALQHWLGWGPGGGGPALSLSGEVIVGSCMLTWRGQGAAARKKLSPAPFWLLVMSQLFSALPSDVFNLQTGYRVPQRRRVSGTSQMQMLGASPAPFGSGSAEREGRAALGGSVSGEIGRAVRTEANPGADEPRGGRQVREVEGEGAVPQGWPRVAAAPRVRPGRGGRARPRSRARTAAVAAARQPCSSRPPHPAPAQRSPRPVHAGASSWTAAAAARGAGGQQRDGTPSRDQGKEGTSCGRGWQCPWGPEGEGRWPLPSEKRPGASWRGWCSESG